MKRRPANTKSARRQFSRRSGTKRINTMPRPMRGGFRL